MGFRFTHLSNNKCSFLQLSFSCWKPGVLANMLLNRKAICYVDCLFWFNTCQSKPCASYWNTRCNICVISGTRCVICGSFIYHFEYSNKEKQQSDINLNFVNPHNKSIQWPLSAVICNLKHSSQRGLQYPNPHHYKHTRTHTHVARKLNSLLNVQIKQSLHRPGLALWFPRGLGSQISGHSTHDSGNVLSHTHWTHLPPPPPQEMLLVPISVRGWADTRAIVRPKRLHQWKIPMTSSGIEPVSFRLPTECAGPTLFIW
jgi:hypothetical protein